MSSEQLRESLLRRYEENVIRNADGCWGWRRRVSAKPGYPWLGSGHLGRVSMHRFSYEIHVGPVPDGEWVLHRCDNKICTRPDHLYLGDHAQNQSDIRDRLTSIKPTCRKGHPKTPENTYVRIDQRGYTERHCIPCKRSQQGVVTPRGVGHQTTTHCRNGHDLAEVGTYSRVGGRRRCRPCTLASNKRNKRPA
jgi:hypothetical protein